LSKSVCDGSVKLNSYLANGLTPAWGAPYRPYRSRVLRDARRRLPPRSPAPSIAGRVGRPLSPRARSLVESVCKQFVQQSPASVVFSECPVSDLVDVKRRTHIHARHADHT
jgi:hypothetical protein